MRALDAAQNALRGTQIAAEHGPQEAAEAHLEAAAAAAEIYERLVQLEAVSAPSNTFGLGR